jgi:predicted dienelactone hydrolase
MDHQVGYRALPVVDDVQQAAIPTGLLYPTLGSTQPTRVDSFTLEVATDAVIDGSDLPLVLISHGTGSNPWLFRDLGAHLAQAGFVVAFVRHPGNNRGDDALAFTVENLINRPRHLQLVINAVYADDAIGPHLAKDCVAVIGHSLGGYTGLALAGGDPTAGPHDTKDGSFRPLDVTHDPRVRALVLLAPATTWYVPEGSLSNVDIPILIRTGERDEYAITYHGELVKERVRDPERVDLKVVPNAGHFSFLSPYPEALRSPQLPPSQDPPGFNRAAYQVELRDEIAAFLSALRRVV